MEMRQAEIESPEDRRTIAELWSEYLWWVDGELKLHYGIDMAGELDTTIDRAVEKDLDDLLASFAPPKGRALLIYEGDDPVGIGCLRPTGNRTGEIKRMYVRPHARGRGFGRQLLDELLRVARKARYHHVCLDSVRFMHAAHRLYRSAGFRIIEPYDESEVPPQLWEYWVFMGLDLDQG